MNDILITNVRALQPGQGIVASSLLLKNGLISELDPEPERCGGADTVDGNGNLLTPGLIDIHTHGIEGERYDAASSIEPGSMKLGRFGTTTAIATLSGRVHPHLCERLNSIAAAAERAEGAHMDMFHLEGPFLALPGAGGPGSPGDVTLLDDIHSACSGHLKAMSISPDTENIIPVIESLVEKGVRPLITHTRADVEQTRRAIDAGARHATHFYDVFHLPGEADSGVRPVGAVEVILADPRCTVDFIADGVHVHPAAIECALAAKGYGSVALITDANSGAGRPYGIYEEGWQDRRICVSEAGGCRIHDPGGPMHGILSGSALTMDRGIGNLRHWLDLPDEQIWAMGTSVPASIMGLSHRGVIKQDAEADLVLWDDHEDHPRAIRTWVGGREIGAWSQ